MPTAETKEPSAQDIWNEEAALREGTTAKAAEPTVKEAATEEQVIDTKTESTASTETVDESTAKQTEDDKSKEAEADLNKQLLERFDKLESRQRNVEGHIGGLKTAQQKLLETMEAARTATDANKPSQKQVAAAAASSEKWELLKKDFPEWAEATEELLAARLGTQVPAGVNPEDFDKKLDERLSKVLPELRQEIVESTLEGMFPGWKEEVKTSAFGEWFKVQKPDVQKLAESEGVGDAAKLLRLYESAKAEDPSEKIVNDRKQKLSNAVALPKGKVVPAEKTLDQMTDKELWDYEAKKREQARAKQLGL